MYTCLKFFSIFAMEKTAIQPTNVTKPIQLLAAWMVGLITVVGMFLHTSVQDGLTDNMRWFLLGASALSVPFFLVSIFLMQTKFRTQMQSDDYYNKSLRDGLLSQNKAVSVEQDYDSLAEDISSAVIKKLKKERLEYSDSKDNDAPSQLAISEAEKNAQNYIEELLSNETVFEEVRKATIEHRIKEAIKKYEDNPFVISMSFNDNVVGRTSIDSIHVAGYIGDVIQSLGALGIITYQLEKNPGYLSGVALVYEVTDFGKQFLTALKQHKISGKKEPKNSIEDCGD